MKETELNIQTDLASDTHVSRENLLAFKQDKMTFHEKVLFLNHISSCMHCSDQLTELMTEEIIPAPKDMKENILKLINNPEIKVSKNVKEMSKRVQLLIYSLKIGFATVSALFLLLSTVNNSNPIGTVNHFGQEYFKQKTSNPVTTAINSRMETLGTGIDTISNNMLEMSTDIFKGGKLK